MRWFVYNIMPTVVVCILCACYFESQYHFYPYKINNNVEKKFYVINLSSNKDRWRDTRAQGDKYDIKLERFSATDGYQIILEDLESGIKITGQELADKSALLVRDRKYKVFCDPHEDYEYIYNTQYVGSEGIYMMSAGEIGLICSSRKLWRKIAESTPEHISVIFEDDIALYENFDQHIGNILSHLPESWDIIYIAAGFTPASKKFTRENDYLDKSLLQMTTWGTYAYIINQRSAKILLDQYNDWNFYAVDQFLGYMNKTHKIRVFVAKEKILGLRDIPSGIQKMGRV